MSWRQSQGVGQNANAAWRRLLILESKAKERLSTMYNVQAEYLVEVFKYPGTGFLPTLQMVTAACR